MRENPFGRFESVKTKYEVKNGTGEKICDVELEYASAESDLGNGLKGRQLTAVLLEKDMPEGSKRVDLITWLKTELPNDFRLFEFESSKGQGFFNLYDNWALVPKPSTSANIGTLLHELGHAAQSREEKYRNMLELKDETFSSALLWNSEWQKDLEKMKPTFSEAEWTEMRAFQSRLEPLIIKRRQLSEQYRALNEKLKNAKGDPELMAQVGDVIDRTVEVESEIDEITKGRFNELVDRPLKASERDATRRAFEWMRSLKKEGFDFLGKINRADDMVSSAVNCVPGITRKKADAYQALKKGLASYRAARPTKK